MKRVAGLLVATGCVAVGALQHQATPLSKVVEMLTTMETKGQKAIKEEQAQFAAFQTFCDLTAAEKKRTIDEESGRIESFKADAEKAKADANRLVQEIASHGKDLESAEADLTKSTQVRESEKAAFVATHKDYTESIAAITNAMTVLKQKGAAAAKSGNALVQVAALSLLPSEDKLTLNSFLEGPGGYGSATGGVQQMLQHLKEKFQEDRSKLEKEEIQKQHAFELLAQGLKAQQSQAKNQKQEKTEFMAKKNQVKADAEGSLAQEQANLKADTKYRNDLLASCSAKAADFQDRQKLRTEELGAIKKAKELITSSVKPKAALVQKATTSLAVLRAKTMSPVQAKAARFLQDEASKLNSKELSALALKAQQDPLGKVKVMIKDLVARLQEEAAAEETQKSWCDKELKTNNATVVDKTNAARSLSAEIEGLNASIAQLGQEAVDLAKASANIDKATANATQIRQKEKAENAVTIKDSQEAVTAIASAIKLLQDFYAKAGKSSFLQVAAPKGAPAIFDKPFTGQESGGVISMLEVLQSDYSRIQSETSAAEDAAQKSFTKFLEDSKKDKAAKQKDIEFSAGKKQEAKTALASKVSYLEGTQKELKAAKDYLEKLKPQCFKTDLTPEQKAARRAEEIKSLKDTLDMLNAQT